MIKRVLILLFSITVMINVAQAESGPLDVADAFLKKIMQGEAKSAVQTYMQPKVKELLGAQLQSVLAQIKAYSKSFGGFENAELLHSEKLSSRLQRIVYIAHTPTLPIAYEIFVYKSNGKWRVTAFNFDSEMDVIFPALIK